MFSDPDELQLKIDEYFELIKGEFHMEEVENSENEFEDVKVWDTPPEPATITGLALHLGFESRQSFYDYGNKAGFAYTIKRARFRIEHSYEKALNFSKQPAAQIFALKNLGWVDSQAVDHTTKGESINPTPIKFTKGSNSGTETI